MAVAFSGDFNKRCVEESAVFGPFSPLPICSMGARDEDEHYF
jgi:hypothetical protein